MPLDRIGWILRTAARGAARYRLQTALIALAAVGGTAGMITSTGYAVGGREKMLNQFSRMGAKLLIVTPLENRATGMRARTGGLVTTLNRLDYHAILQSVEGIRAASATVATVLRMRVGDLTKNVSVVGCEPDYFPMKSWRVVSGDYYDRTAERTQARVVLLGATVARDMFGGDDPTGRRILINRIPFVVAGVLEERGQGPDAANEDDQAYVPLSTATHKLLHIDYFNSILVESISGSRMYAVEDQITSLLLGRHGRLHIGRPDFQVLNQKRLIEAQLAAFDRLTFFIQWIAASTLVVSSLGVFAVTWIGVRHRSREIGTRRAIGATRADILLQFVAEGMVCTFSGSVAGVGTGFVLLRWMDAVLSQPFKFPTAEAASQLLGSIALYAAFTLASALKATRIRPSVALRSD